MGLQRRRVTKKALACGGRKLATPCSSPRHSPACSSPTGSVRGWCDSGGASSSQNPFQIGPLDAFGVAASTPEQRSIGGATGADGGATRLLGGGRAFAETCGSPFSPAAHSAPIGGETARLSTGGSSIFGTGGGGFGTQKQTAANNPFVAASLAAAHAQNGSAASTWASTPEQPSIHDNTLGVAGGAADSCVGAATGVDHGTTSLFGGGRGVADTRGSRVSPAEPSAPVAGEAASPSTGLLPAAARQDRLPQLDVPMLRRMRKTVLEWQRQAALVPLPEF